MQIEFASLQQKQITSLRKVTIALLIFARIAVSILITLTMGGHADQCVYVHET